jgi:NAD(P)-dependent dehydrogenase (short-subunit alcohol dehydrogenase family)
MSHKRIAIVTGGSSGIGFATAKKFTENGIFTLIVGRNKQKIDDAVSCLKKNCASIQFDMTQVSQIPSLIQQFTDQYGPIDILVNNAGINMKKNLTEVTDEDFQKILHTNLTSVFAISREVAKAMIPRKKGCIINISSMAAHYGLPGVIAYTASKSAIEGITRAMAVELSPLGIRVNCIAPGFIVTNMSSTALDSDPERKKRVMMRTPLGKMGSPGDVANILYFLTTDESSYMTGAVIPVDGGNSIGF